jgi:hypothetical protein
MEGFDSFEKKADGEEYGRTARFGGQGVGEAEEGAS